MKYRYDKKVKKRWFRKRRTKQIVLTILPLMLLAAGAYILLLLMSPAIQKPSVSSSWNEPVPHGKVELTEDRMYIPKLKLNLTYKAGNASVLRENVWHRFPERGNPERGGNFILAGHRFEIGLTPGETKRRSPFYHIDALLQGDKIYVDFKGKRYLYEVTDRYKVKPNQTEIEAPSEEAKMTLYTCTFQGAADGREVVIAHLVEKDVDPSIKF